ncbi:MULTISPECIES: TetR/AcrR family transcriptional regulator [Streptomyces]|uniref:TetR/AcrR family transcriptional regulator n=1 Tax=Streptomyces TaxID=1883 RepID=UPI0039BDFB81
MAWAKVGPFSSCAECRFYADGVTTTGIDTITAEAGVAKMSLYNNFSSKADLVRAYLDARHEEWLAMYNAAAELPAGDEGRTVVRRHKEEVERLISGHLEELLPERPDDARAMAAALLDRL